MPHHIDRRTWPAAEQDVRLLTMWHVALGLGVLITNVILKPVYFAVFFQSGIAVDAAFYRMQLLAEVCIAVGLVIGWYIERRLALEARILRPVPGYWALRVGVWLFFLVWVAHVASRTIPYAVYLIGAFPTRYLIQSQLPVVIANALIAYGLARVFLAASPNERGKEPNSTVERDGPQAARPSL